MEKKKYELNKNFTHDVKVQEVREKALGELLTNKTIELKTEMGMWKDTGNIAVEVKFDGKLSGIAKTKADHWWHTLELNGKPFVHIVFDTETFKKHIERVGLKPEKCKGLVFLELGPGDSLFSSILAKGYGASQSIAVDDGEFSDHNIENYIKMISYLKEKGIKFPDIGHIKNIEELMQAINAKYYTSGLLSLKNIESETVDFIWSEAVLEHIRLSEFYLILIELNQYYTNLLLYYELKLCFLTY